MFSNLPTQKLLATLISFSVAMAIPASIHAAGNQASLDTRVERLERRISRLSELMMQVDALKRENSELRGQIELQNHTINSLKNRQRDLYIDIDQRLTQLQAGSQKPAAAAGTAPVTDASAAQSKPPVAEISKPVPVAEVPAPLVLSTSTSTWLRARKECCGTNAEESFDAGRMPSGTCRPTLRNSLQANSTVR